MELLQLAYFCDAAETQNFSKTAKKYNVPPSNISQSVKRLETELEVTLFERTANRVALSERGRVFYTDVKRALTILERSRDALYNGEDEGCLKINIQVSRRLAMEAIEKFQACFPRVDIVTRHEPETDPMEFDLVVTDKRLNADDLVCTEAVSEDIVIAFKRGLLSENNITADDLKNKPFITMNAGNSLYEATREICGDMGFAPRIALQSEDPLYVRKCVELGLGVAFVPSYSWRGEFSSEVVLKKIGEYTRHIYVYRRNGNHLPSYLIALYEMLVQEYAK